MKRPLEITTRTEVKYNGHPAEEIICDAIDLAHRLLEELSVHRQRNDITEPFACEGDACEFLDKAGD
jgi:hypothetical protein